MGNKMILILGFGSHFYFKELFVRYELNRRFIKLIIESVFFHNCLIINFTKINPYKDNKYATCTEGRHNFGSNVEQPRVCLLTAFNTSFYLIKSFLTFQNYIIS